MAEFDNKAERFRREDGLNNKNTQRVGAEPSDWAEELKNSQTREVQLKKIADKAEKERKLSLQKARDRRLRNKPQIKHYRKSLGQIWAMMKKVKLENRGWYLMAFIASVVADIVTAIIGLAQGAVGAVPVVGWVADALAEGMVSTIILFFIVLIFMIYLFAGHYKRAKKGKILLRASTQVGVSFAELIPVINALPMFTAAFVVNYLLALYGRAVEVMEEESKKSKVVGVVSLLKRNRA